KGPEGPGAVTRAPHAPPGFSPKGALLRTNPRVPLGGPAAVRLHGPADNGAAEVVDGRQSALDQTDRAGPSEYEHRKQRIPQLDRRVADARQRQGSALYGCVRRARRRVVDR